MLSVSIKILTIYKPIKFPYIIVHWINENEVVLDNCMGVGSTGKAAKILNRKFIGIELNEEYYNLSIDFIQKDP